VRREPKAARRGSVRADVEVKQHPIFERDGKHLYCEVPITFADARWAVNWKFRPWMAA
jgi:DnaJ-class molecular chaperone